MRLTDLEQSWLDGAGGAAKQRAMDLLVCYGEALGAERLVATRNVAGTWNSGSPGVAPFAEHSLAGVLRRRADDAFMVLPMENSFEESGGRGIVFYDEHLH